MTASGIEPHRVWAWARVLGAVQESQRLGHERVELGHLLLTVYADPVVRGVLVRNGLDLRDVQVRVGALPVPQDRVLHPSGAGPVAVTAIAPDAEAVLRRLGCDLAPEGAGTATGPTAPGPSFARIHRTLAVLLLGDEAPAALEDLLDGLLSREARRRIVRRLTPAHLT